MLFDCEYAEDGIPARFCSTMEQKHVDPRIRELMKSPVGRYLIEHPFVALTLMVFTVMATVPIGLFLGFALVTFAATTVSVVFIEVFLLALGGATLLCALGSLAIAAVGISSLLTSCYLAVSCIYKLFYRERLPEMRKRWLKAKHD
ncbi:lipid droplet assembly factor 1-like isoform X2 [Engraulis encrasicolus]